MGLDAKFIVYKQTDEKHDGKFMTLSTTLLHYRKNHLFNDAMEKYFLLNGGKESDLSCSCFFVEITKDNLAHLASFLGAELGIAPNRDKLAIKGIDDRWHDFDIYLGVDDILEGLYRADDALFMGLSVRYFANW